MIGRRLVRALIAVWAPATGDSITWMTMQRGRFRVADRTKQRS